VRPTFRRGIRHSLDDSAADDTRPAIPEVANTLSVAGSTQRTATAIPVGQDLSIFTSVSSGQGCSLPGVGVSVAETYSVANHGSNALLIYPASGGMIGTLGTNTGYSLAAGHEAHFTRVSGSGKARPVLPVR
jgi:hypothetical protein